METHFVLIDRGVVYTTERGRRQVFPGCVFWVVFNGVQFYLSTQLTQESHGIVESKEKREFCMYLLDSATDCIIACFMCCTVGIVRCRQDLNAWSSLITSK